LPVIEPKNALANPTVEKIHCLFLAATQAHRSEFRRIAMGILVGSEIAHIDEITMLKAIEGRQDM